MNKQAHLIDLRNVEDISKRPKIVSRELDKLGNGEQAEIISNDERRLKAAPRMINAIGKARHLASWKGQDGYYHTLVEKN